MVTGWVHLTGIIIVSFFIYKKGVTLDRTARFFQTKTKRNKTRVLVTALILGQVVVAGVLNTYQLMNDTNYSTGFLVSGLLLILTALMSGYFIRKMFLQSEQDVVLETYESFIDNINTLYTTVRGQRHDFIHHAQVLFSMITTGQPKEAEQYLAQLIGEIQEVNELIKVKNPVLNSLLNSKMAVAAGKNTKLSAVIKTNLDNCRIRPLDLVKVLGNLIDNALDAVQNQPQEYKKANVLIKEESGIHVFEVTNPRPLIPPVVISRIFETGFSTKKDHTGLGLAVTKEIITRLGGNINVRSNPEEGTVFTVVVPVK
jgi:signal transduction histidine kinase